MHGPLLIALLLPPTLAEELSHETPEQVLGLTVGAELAGRSRYLWRGMMQSEGPVLQPSIWFGVENVLLTAWSNIDLTEVDGRGVSEVDLVLSFAQEWESMSFTPALVLYVLPGAENTAEATGDFAWELGHFGLYSNHAVDFWDAKPAWWSESGASVHLPLADALALESSAGLSVGNRTFESYYLGLDQGGLLYACGGLGLDWAHRSGLYAALHGHLDLPLATEHQGDEPPVHGVIGLALGWDHEATLVR
jgi:hypothetical protein